MNAPLPDAIRKALETVTLDDKYSLEHGRAFMSGTQALVRLPMLQKKRDALFGLKTGGFISGYRGSPLGGYDQALWQAKSHLAAQDIVFQPGVNEELGATAVWGTQQLDLYPESKRFDGVFGIWYGKGPGVDRCSDVFKHANLAGTAKHGGVIALAGDDHIAKSSTAAHQSDHIFKACGLPVFFPSSVQDILDMGLHAFALSRFAGVWSGMKTIQEIVESAASVSVDPDRVDIILPEDFEMPPGGLHIRWPDAPLEQEARLMNYKWYAALAYVRANRLNHNVIEGSRDRFGIIASGKAYNDTRQALFDLGLDDDTCRRIGLRLHKVNVVWPLEASITREFALGLEEILVVEEKRQVIEYQLKEQLYGWRPDVRPHVLGKFDESESDEAGGEWGQANPSQHWLLRAQADLTPAIIAKAIARRLARLGVDPEISARMTLRVALIEAKEQSLAVNTVTGAAAGPERAPWFCSGCPHNTSTKVPEGSRAVAGIGCHYMAVWMDRSTVSFSQMGGEGVSWIGQAPFTTDNHIFANLGDGTYFHSGLLAVRQSIAAGVNITYKILFNDAVAMTGGQPIDGTLKVPEMTRELDAEGAKRVVVVTDEPEKYAPSDIKSRLAPGVTVHHRDDLDAVQKELRTVPGCTVIVYDQTCATEKRRRRKRGTMEDPARRVVINELVCEGCGDCSVQSNCLSVEPIETEFGRKRRINQNTCNKDYACLKGFCPSFITVEGGKLKSGKKGGGSSRPKLSSVGTPPEPGAAGGRAALGHRRRRCRRHRRHHHRPAARHGRAPRGQGHRHPGFGRPGAEGRRDLEPHPDRQPARGDLLDQGRHRRGRPGDRLRSDRRRRPGLARGDARRPHLRRPQHPRDADRRLRQRPRLAVPGGQCESLVLEAVGPEHIGKLDADSARGAARRRLDLHQPADARLRLAAGQGAAQPRGADARDRAQRRADREQQGGVRMGPARRRRAEGSEGAGPHRPGDRAGEALDQPRRHDRQAGRVPHRLPERGLRRGSTSASSTPCAPRKPTWCSRAPPPAPTRAGPAPSSPRRWPATCSS
jgi:indolepyruvate ferredoxin oxidoreductase